MINKISATRHNLDNFITIDPGRNTGIAIWNLTKTPFVYEIITPKKLIGIEMLAYLHKEFKFILSMCTSLKYAIVEGVDYRENSLISKTAALRGDLSILSYVVGTYIALLREYNAGMNIRVLTAQEWKGNLTKEATEKRVSLINQCEYRSSHVIDAVAMGFSQTEYWNLGCDK